MSDLQRRLKKPARGTFRKERAARARGALGRERFEKAEVRAREQRNKPDVKGRCRWPHDDLDDRIQCRRERREVAHRKHKGMGGDRRTIRSRRSLMINVCVSQHRKIDKGLATYEVIDHARGADGPLIFFERLSTSDPFLEVGREIHAGVLERRR